MSGNNVLTRRFRLVSLLSQEARGLSSRRLAEKLGTSRPTIDRDLKALREEIGVRISRKRVSDEVWHVLDGLSLSLAITPLQIAALKLARTLVEPLQGTALVRELDRLLTAMPAQSEPTGVRAHRRKRRLPTVEETVTSRIDDALEKGRRIKIDVRVASREGQLCSYVLDPLTIRLSQTDSYLDAWSVEKGAVRSFKITRIQHVDLLQEQADDHNDVDIDELFRDAIKTWSGETTRVRIRIVKEAAWLAPEYKLVEGQRLLPSEDGGVIVEADVSGIVEVSRWVLSWGKKAEALEPPELRALVQTELEQALASYRPSPSQATTRSAHAV